MGYNNDVYETAYKILEERRDRNKYLKEKRKEEIFSKLPEYKKLKTELMSVLGGYVSNIGSENKKTDNFDIRAAVSENEAKIKTLLTSNGYPVDYLDDIYDCEKCKDTGYILDKKCECLEKLLIKIAVKKSNLSNHFDEQNFEKFDINLFSDKPVNGISPRENIKKILVHIKEFTDNFDKKDTKPLLFTGSTGVGKTFLSSCIAKKMTEAGYEVLYETAGNVCEILDAHKFGKVVAGAAEDRSVKDLYSSELLIIDDLGTEFKSTYTISAIYELINARLISNKKMIINTNLSVKELKDAYSERLFSRFLGEFTILEFIGEDLRTKRILEN